jgi:hypothetical protein
MRRRSDFRRWAMPPVNGMIAGVFRDHTIIE